MELSTKVGDKSFLVCEGCDEVTELKNLGLVIYRYKVNIGNIQDDKATGALDVSTGSTKDIFIILNTRDITVPASAGDSEKDPYIPNCKRCQYIMQRGKRYLERNRQVERQDISSICDHCRVKQQYRNVQTICDEIITKYFLGKTGGRDADLYYRSRKPTTWKRPNSNLELRTSMEKQLILKNKWKTEEKRQSLTRFHSHDSYITSFPSTKDIDNYPLNKFFFPKDDTANKKTLQVDVSSAELISGIRERQRIQSEELEKKAARGMELSNEDIIETGAKDIVKPRKKETTQKIQQQKIKEGDKARAEKTESKDQLQQRSMTRANEKSKLGKENKVPIETEEKRSKQFVAKDTQDIQLKGEKEKPKKVETSKLGAADGKKKESATNGKKVEEQSDSVKGKQDTKLDRDIKLKTAQKEKKQEKSKDTELQAVDNQTKGMQQQTKEKPTKETVLKLPPKLETSKLRAADDKKKESAAKGKKVEEQSDNVKGKQNTKSDGDVKLKTAQKEEKQEKSKDTELQAVDNQTKGMQQQTKEKPTKETVLKLPPKLETSKLRAADDKKKESAAKGKKVEEQSDNVKGKQNTKSDRDVELKTAQKEEKQEKSKGTKQLDEMAKTLAKSKQERKKETEIQKKEPAKMLAENKSLQEKDHLPKGKNQSSNKARKSSVSKRETVTEGTTEIKKADIAHHEDKEKMLPLSLIPKDMKKNKEDLKGNKIKKEKVLTQKELNMVQVVMVKEDLNTLNVAMSKIMTPNPTDTASLLELPPIPRRFEEDNDCYKKHRLDNEDKLKKANLKLLKNILSRCTDKSEIKQLLAQMNVSSDTELDIESFLNETKPFKNNEIINGDKIVSLDSLALIEEKIIKDIPMVFEKKITRFPNIEHIGRISSAESISEKAVAINMDDVQRQMLRYTLSDRSFIDKGWTMLPTEKMNIYRMRPVHPEFDWFKRNKNKGYMKYNTGEKLAEFEQNGRGRCYYRNGRLALNYYDAEEPNARQRYVVYSTGEPDKNGHPQPVTVLAMFDYSGNGIVFDHNGKARLKYNQTEGVVLDKSLGPVTNWKWHSLNDPPDLKKVMIDTHVIFKDPRIVNLVRPDEINHKLRPNPEQKDMIRIEFENFLKEKEKKMSANFQPYQIKMKALEINEHFSLRILDQATIYLHFHDGPTHMKLNLGMLLDHREIVDTQTVELGNVWNSLEQFPARTESIERLQKELNNAQLTKRMRVERENRLKHPVSRTTESADRLEAALSRPPRTTAGKIASRFSYTAQQTHPYELCQGRKSASWLH